MALLKVKEFRELFQNRISSSSIIYDNQFYSPKSELLFDQNQRFVLSFQAKKTQESFKSFINKFEYAKTKSQIFIPIFLGGTSNEFILGKCTKPETLQRVRNCGEQINDLYNVNEKLKIASEMGDGFIYIYNPQEKLLKISKSSLALGKNLPTYEYLHSTERISSDRKFEPSVYKRVLHIGLERIINLENLIFFDGEFQDMTSEKSQLELF